MIAGEGIPILGITGHNGSGKTLYAVEMCLRDLAAGNRVVSTVDIDDGELRSEPLVSMGQLLELEDCTVLLDEVAVIFSSRQGGALPSEFVTFLQTIRHRQVRVIWTAPNWLRADVLLRAVTQASATVRPLVKRAVKGSYWPRPLLSGIGVMDTLGIATDARPERVLRRRLWRPTKSPAWGSFDTHAPTPQLLGRARSGACPHCGGQRPSIRCSPERHEALDLAPPVVDL